MDGRIDPWSVARRGVRKILTRRRRGISAAAAAERSAELAHMQRDAASNGDVETKRGTTQGDADSLYVGISMFHPDPDPQVSTDSDPQLASGWPVRARRALTDLSGECVPFFSRDDTSGASRRYLISN